MNFIELFIYSFIQGATEFLPISSSSHLLLFESIFNWTGVGRTFAIAAHLGTLLTLLFFLRSDIMYILKNFKIYEYRKNSSNILILNIIIITIPITIIGLFIFKKFDNLLLNLQVIGWATILGAILLLISDKSQYRKKTLSDLSYIESFFIGILQSFALIPGSSRAGMIITASRFLKINRKNSTHIALFSGIPTISCAVILECSWLISNSNDLFNVEIILVIILSSLFSYLAIVYLFKWINRNSFLPFIIYRLIIGIIILTFVYF